MNKILKYATLIYALLVFVGYINMHSYFRQFGIDIWTYLSTGELLLSFMPLAVPLLFIGFALVMLYVLFTVNDEADTVNPFNALRNPPKELLSIKPILDEAKKIKLKGHGILGWIIRFIGVVILYALAWVVPVAMIGLLIILALEIRTGNDFIWGSQITGTAAFTWIPLFLMYAWSRFGWTRDVVWKYIAAAGVTGFMVLFLFAENRISARDVMEGRTFTRLTIRTDEQVLSTGKYTGYIGKCNAAVFLYDRLNQASVIIPVDRVKRMSVGVAPFEDVWLYLLGIKSPEEVGGIIEDDEEDGGVIVDDDEDTNAGDFPVDQGGDVDPDYTTIVYDSADFGGPSDSTTLDTNHQQTSTSK